MKEKRRTGVFVEGEDDVVDTPVSELLHRIRAIALRYGYKHHPFELAMVRAEVLSDLGGL